MKLSSTLVRLSTTTLKVVLLAVILLALFSAVYSIVGVAHPRYA